MAVALAGFSFMLTVIWGPPLIRVLRYFKMGKAIRVEGPERHFTKLGTPTMGGVMIVIPVVSDHRADECRLSDRRSPSLGDSVILPMFTMVMFTALGAVDDWAGSARRTAGEGAAGAHQVYRSGHSWADHLAFALRYMLDVPGAVLARLSGRNSAGHLVYPDCALTHRVDVECSQPDRWAGWAGRADLGNCFCGLWRHCLDSGAGLPGAFLFYRGGRRSSAFCGSTSTRRSCSWEIPVRSRWAPPWRWSR